jgi:hypothetical protein
MSLFKEIKSLVDKIEGSLYIDVNECAWTMADDGELYFNTDSNLEELYCGNGDTYSGEVIGSSWGQDDCVFFNVDNGCGETITHVFLENLEVSWSDLEEMFDGEEGDE